ncbi:hypothetical protein [Brevundimonas sp. LM2]|uniref:hypothetical protein n=1 Tax=Brevundimonas sp. LM2 TaxID=1938605 RepID=UPI00209B1A95|nr:hypothetical protein [Brevundimonas sp. LM2]
MRIVAAALMAGATGLAACDRASDKVEVGGETPAARAPGAAASSQTVGGPSNAGPEAGSLIVPGAPAFAVLYPGGEIEAPPTIASDAVGSGGLVTFRTDAAPETIVTFYRTHAEAAGLSSVMAMNMGEARSYGAAKAGVGTSLQVVASPLEEGGTSVQVSWSAGG